MVHHFIKDLNGRFKGKLEFLMDMAIADRQGRIAMQSGIILFHNDSSNLLNYSKDIRIYKGQNAQRKRKNFV